MRDNVLVIILVIIAVLYTVVVTGGLVTANQREFVCVELGYDGYALGACYTGTNPKMLYPYETVFDRIE